jgi:protein yorkie
MSPQPQQPQQRSGSFDNLEELPAGWEQSVTPEGEVYYINHATKTTTWFDPRRPNANQRVPIRAPVGHPGATGNRQQDARLQRLENERRAVQRAHEVNQQRQAEIKKRLERRAQSQENMQAAMNQTQEMLMRHTIIDSNHSPGPSGGSGMDPAFLSSAQAAAAQAAAQAAQTELHNRQESADSGVGGMGSNFNLGSIPEDLPEGMDTSDLDTTLTPGSSGTPGPESTTSGAPTPTTSVTGGAGGAGSNGNSNMMDSTDQLMPSLPAELGEVLDADIMQDVLGGNKGGMTWL